MKDGGAGTVTKRSPSCNPPWDCGHCEDMSLCELSLQRDKCANEYPGVMPLLRKWLESWSLSLNYGFASSYLYDLDKSDSQLFYQKRKGKRKASG